ncbi:MAG: cob(I)yrinic acid a,c-diamide adenosyltransferase [Oscillospiraceae bacterium]|nr:cob(I)yrinic acid a,c-diamide adenosyltransferase [Oscillospiraceae bacterium]
MLHIYHGPGKGKTTAAFGLALRAAGRGRRGVIAQFLKGEDSGERRSMEFVPHVLLLPLPERVKFSFQMDVVERAECMERSVRLVRDAALLMERDGVLVLDEVLDAVNLDFLPLEELLEALDHLPEGCEVVLTGRNPAAELLEKADYITYMDAVRHPYEKGVAAREGIEY